MVLSIGPDVYSTFQFGVLSPEPEPPEMDPEPGKMEPEPPELEPPEMMMVTESEMLVPEPPEMDLVTTTNALLEMVPVWVIPPVMPI
jgi:hypothetical protein